MEGKEEKGQLQKEDCYYNEVPGLCKLVQMIMQTKHIRATSLEGSPGAHFLQASWCCTHLVDVCDGAWEGAAGPSLL